MKGTASLGGVPLAASGPLAWRVQTGTQPYTTVFEVYTEDWEKRLERRKGQPLQLFVHDARGIETRIEGVYILHEVATTSPYRTAFVVADKRWKWPYIMVARDYNVPQKTGDRDADGNKLPVETRITVDKYTYKPYSLFAGQKKWQPKEAVEDVLKLLNPQETAAEGYGYVIESFPLEGNTSDGQYSMQNVILRDSGDVALARLLSYIPGAEVYIDFDGRARVFDGVDLKAAEAHVENMPPSTYDGEVAAMIDRKKIRPNRVIVHYERELEVVFAYEDDYSTTTSANPVRTEPYIENVLPTVDPETVLYEYDPEGNVVDKKTVPVGTWVRVDRWLNAMDADAPTGSYPWTFETIRVHWAAGDLEGVLGGGGSRGIYDDVRTANVGARVQALRQHFRQTFRINRRYISRVREIKAVRVALLDPVTGARAPAAVWPQITVIPSQKAHRIAKRKDKDKGGVWAKYDFLPPTPAPGEPQQKLRKTEPGPGRVNFLDRDLGIFRVEYIASPYGTVSSILPCWTVYENNQGVVPTRDLERQEKAAMGTCVRYESGSNALLLSPTMELKVMVTMSPAAPNNKARFHKEPVDISEVSSLFRFEYGLQDGEGPDLEVYVPPSEATVRYAWDDDDKANDTIVELLGLDEDDPNKAGIDDDPDTPRDETRYLPGFIWINEQVEIHGHSRAVAAEMIAAYADSIQGRVATVMPNGGQLYLKGNMTGATMQVAAAPDGKINATHDFPGKQKPVSRLALMPEAARQVVLGLVKFGGEA